MKRIALALALSSMLWGCGSDTGDDVLKDISAITFIQRPTRSGGLGDIFQYTSYVPGARLVELSPPTADGQLTVLCCDQAGAEYADIDIAWYDISFDARQIVMSARLSGDQSYGLFLLTLQDGKVEQLSSDPDRDYVFPIFVPGDRILFFTNAVVEEGAPQHRDEYERGTTTQVGTMRVDGSDPVLGARNLSHRVYPTLMSDGRVMFTQWDHLGDENAGHLLIMNPDTTTVREGFGKEDTGITNSYLKAVEVAPGRVVAIGTDRDRTIQSGAILGISLGTEYTDDQSGDTYANRDMSEANAHYEILTPQVPLDNRPSPTTIGRYYDAYPVNAKNHPDLLVSWSDGPVEDETLGAAGLSADFGIYLYDSENYARKPIWNDPAYWDVFPRPLRERRAPPAIPPAGVNQFNANHALLGSMNVYDSSLDTFEPGSIVKVRIIEGFSGEEGVGEDFGLSEHEGAALIGEADVRSDGSWAALVPANIPLHLQPIDKFGMSERSEPVWISGAAGEARFCGGCHEDRAGTTVINPGITEAIALGPIDFATDRPRSARVSMDFSRDAVVGVPWNLALQPIFDAKCVSCHDGDASKPGNKSFTITDPITMTSQTFVFDLRGQVVEYGFGDEIMSGYSASHLSLLGPMMADLEEQGLIIEGDLPIYVEPASARDSLLIQKLNPPQLYPSYDPSVRAFDTPVHPADVPGGVELTEDEYYLLILMADAGGQFYSRENNPGEDY